MQGLVPIYPLNHFAAFSVRPPHHNIPPAVLSWLAKLRQGFGAFAQHDAGHAEAAAASVKFYHGQHAAQAGIDL